MARTISWTPRVGEVWEAGDGTHVEIVGDHNKARLVLLRRSERDETDTEWVPYETLERDYEQACCIRCGVPLTGMRKLLIEEAERNQPPREPPAPPKPQSSYVKATPGEYCSKPCCATRHAPKTC